MNYKVSKYIYKSGDPKKIGLSPNQTFVYGWWKLLDSVVIVSTFGRVGGKFSDNYIWKQFARNVEKSRSKKASENQILVSEDQIFCCDCDDTCLDEKTAKDDEWGWSYGPDNVQEWFCPECQWELEQ